MKQPVDGCDETRTITIKKYNHAKSKTSFFENENG